MAILALLAAEAGGADVRQVVERHCAGCHRPGQVAPFPLLTAADLRRHRPEIEKTVRAGRMPPWKARAIPGAELEGARTLPAADRDLLLRWLRFAKTDFPPLDLPPVPEWQLGPPDLELAMSEPFTVPAATRDVYQCFVVPLQAGRPRWVRALEFQPGNRNVLHHAIFFLDRSGEARRRDAAHPGPGYPCFGLPGFLPSGSLGGWSPGNRAHTQPAGTALRYPASGDLVLQVHYHATGRAETDRSRLGLYFTDRAPTRQIADIPLSSRAIDIPPGHRDWRVQDAFELPVDVEVVGVIPHAHYVCRAIRARAILPGGKRQELLRIDDWDFDWQEIYRYRQPVRLPAGTRIEAEWSYDNSVRNPRNPSSPPRRVGWGPETTDEMAGLHVQVIAADPREQADLMQALWGKFIRATGVGFWQNGREPDAPAPRPR